jgi:alanine racemase
MIASRVGRRFVRIYKGGDAVAASDSVAEKNEPAAAQAAPPTLPTAAPAAAPPPLPST